MNTDDPFKSTTTTKITIKNKATLEQAIKHFKS